MSTFFDHIPEINIKNSYQKVADLIRENDLSRELIAHLSKDFAQTTNNFVHGASQLIDNNYDETQVYGDRLKGMDKEYDIPFQNLKGNIMEFTQELAYRSDAVSSRPPSANKDDLLMVPEERSAQKEKSASKRSKKLLQDEEPEMTKYSRSKTPKKSPRREEIEEEKSAMKQMGRLRIDDEDGYGFGNFQDENEEDPDANLFDDEFGKPISKGNSKNTTGKTSRNSTQNSNLKMFGADEFESEISTDKGKMKRKAPGAQAAEVAASQGKRIKGTASQIKTNAKTLMDFF